MAGAKHSHMMVTWGGAPHYHGAPERRIHCSEFHGYCMDPLCHEVLVRGDNKSLGSNG